jgi:hypothetical protein
VVGAATRTQQSVEDSASGAAHLCIVSVRLHLYVLNRLDGGNDDGPIVCVRDRHAVDEILVRANRAARHRRLRSSILVGETDKLRIASVDEEP